MPTTRATLRAAGATGAALLLAAGMALRALPVEAVSGGGYNPAQQGCSPTADRNDQPGTAQPGCHNATLQVNQGGGDAAQRWHVLSVNSDQIVQGTSPHSGSITVDPGQGTATTLRFDTGTGTLILVSPLGLAVDLLTWAAGGFQGPAPIPDQIVGSPGRPSAGVSHAAAQRHSPLAGAAQQQVYFGADDNLDNGEHDGVNPDDNGGQDAAVADGPSDGGAVQANTHPQGSLGRPTTLFFQNVDVTDGHDPVRAADAGAGACADGLCAGADSSHRRDFEGGCASCPDQSVYSDQYTTDWRSPDCNGQSTQNQNECGADWQNGNEQGNIYQPYSERGAYYTDPGVFVYSDPDPQASPEFPVTPTYPLCELYVGTMGVWVCSENVVPGPSDIIGGAAAPGRAAAATAGQRGHVATRPLAQRTAPVIQPRSAMETPTAQAPAPAAPAPSTPPPSLPLLPGLISATLPAPTILAR
jgi:hypothetical protein